MDEIERNQFNNKEIFYFSTFIFTKNFFLSKFTNFVLKGSNIWLLGGFTISDFRNWPIQDGEYKMVDWIIGKIK